MEAVVAGGGEGRGSKRGRVKAADPGTEPDAKRRAAAPPFSRWRVPVASCEPRAARTATARSTRPKGIRDRRVRLSVATAIQFYDLQDRLGYDQPSKAIEWLIKAAAAAIDKLPSLDAAAGFPAHPASAAAKDQHHRTPPDADADAPPDADHHQHQQQQLTRSGCSSTSETSKGSVLSLSRSESRVKARERARERSAAARDKDKDPAADDAATTGRRAAPTTSSAQAASFTELLTGMAAATAAAGSAPADHKQQQSPPWQPMAAPAIADYIGFAQPRKAAGHAIAHSFASPAPHLANIAPIAMAPAQHFGLASGAVTVASGGGEPHAEMTQFSFLQDHYMPVHAAPASGPAGDYNLNFSMSSGLVGVNSRGTLQSNSQPHISGHHHQHHQLQRLSTPLDAPNIPFLFSPAAAVTTPATAESQFAAFQLWNGFQHADMKEKGKN
ncbi:hypothetical protein SETIT_2G032900v2 [Setaria italica]|uniref:TCP domain-containing protein n=1 Tax=Setaria italica TaxID=4555 RepID=A0A368PVC8_SETIT|nr:hypothetical protein SETIT_2G032900v2 [Setaria italica]